MVKTGATPLLSIPDERKQRELRHAQEREVAERQRVRTVLFPLLIFAGWQLVGAGLLVSSAWSNSITTGQVLFTGGFAVGYGGAFFHLVVYYTLGRERGDW